MFGIIGDPVSHSLSPLFQARFAMQHGINAVYVPWRVRCEGVATVLDGLWAADVQGFNVTVPHKETVCELVQADADAAAIGAVNTVRRGADGWQGTNTDWQGMCSVFKRLAVNIDAGEALLIGAGGTARAVLHALAQAGARQVHVCNRSEVRLQAFVRHAEATYPDMRLDTVAWETAAVEAVVLRCPLVINTTSIGLADADVSFPFRIGGEGAAVDAVYTPDGQTPFVAAAQLGGRIAVDGLPMLLAQGAASFDWWHDTHAEVEPVMQWMQQRLNRVGAGSKP
ncbi:MAG: shikimate dehydrogenase [Mariprofundaceae bacterium]